MNKILSILLLMSTPFVFAAATDDNEMVELKMIMAF